MSKYQLEVILSRLLDLLDLLGLKSSRHRLMQHEDPNYTESYAERRGRFDGA
jgi:hypothetical protein